MRRLLPLPLLAAALLAPGCRTASSGGASGGHKEMTVTLPGGVPVVFVHAPAGTFMMGAPTDQPDREIDENLHPVTLTKDFWCGKFEVTNRQFRCFRPDHKSWGVGGEKGEFNGDEQPVVAVDSFDADAFVAWAAEKTGRKIRLLTEAEWEYCCRAGSTAQFCYGDDRSVLGDYAWIKMNAQGHTQPVGLKKPNAWGIHDMHGNVAEWVADGYGGVPLTPVTDPMRPPGQDRCWRESSWSSKPFETRCAVRDHADWHYKSAALGIRLACDP